MLWVTFSFVVSCFWVIVSWLRITHTNNCLPFFLLTVEIGTIAVLVMSVCLPSSLYLFGNLSLFTCLFGMPAAHIRDNKRCDASLNDCFKVTIAQLILARLTLKLEEVTLNCVTASLKLLSTRQRNYPSARNPIFRVKVKHHLRRQL